MNVFSDWAYANLVGTTWTGGEIGLALLTRAPDEPVGSAPQGIANLVHALGYSEQVDPGYSRVDAQVTSSTTSGVTSVILGEDFLLPTDVEPAFIRAVAFFFKGSHGGVTDPWLFITDTAFNQVVIQGSTLTTRNQSPRVLFTYQLRGSTVDAAVAGLIRSPGLQDWEPPRTQHIFLYPERVNYVPNPSFADAGLFGWRSKGTLTRGTGGPDGGTYGAITGNRLESLPVLTPSGSFRVSAYIRSKGATQVRLGLTTWPDSWVASTDVLGQLERVDSGWKRLDALIRIPDNTAGTGLLVTSDGAFDADLTMFESTAELNDYFDGDAQTSMIGDFSWQGTPHQSFSFWYNNRNLVGARLFGEYVEGQVTKKGLVYDWVPESTSLYTHWDVLYPEDTRQPLQDWGSRVIP